MNMARPTCNLCGSDMGTFNTNGNHYLCEALASHNMPTPSLGTRCPTCDGAGFTHQGNGLGVMLSLDTNTPGMIARSIEATFPTCRDCNGSRKA